MKTKNPIIALLAALLCLSCSPSLQNAEKTADGIKFTTADGTINGRIVFYSPSIVRIVKYPATIDEMPQKESLSVIASPTKTKVKYSGKEGKTVMTTDCMSVTYDSATGAISFASADGKLLDEKSASLNLREEGADKGAYKVFQSFSLDKDENIYGLGQLQNGKMSQRGQKRYMIQGNTDDYIPFILSEKGYGVYWDNYSPTTFNDNEQETSFDSEVGDCVDYYFMYGGDADGVVGCMRELTGDVPMFPLWTYGFWQSKERYQSQQETVDVVREYRKLGVPLDGIIQDWQYWGDNYHWNAMEFLNPNFPDPQRMVDEIHSLNAHMIISIWASFGPETKPYADLAKGNMLFGFRTWPPSGLSVWPPDMTHPSGVRVFDAYNPEARGIYWKYLKNMYDLGIDGWWMDSTDPDHLDFTDSDLETPTYLGSFRKVRNAFPLMTVGGVYNNQRNVSSDKRIFILTRSVFAGQQRYGANVWSGDTQASWRTLRDQISSGLNMSICGVPHWNSDIGGFFLARYRDKINDPEYRELFVRWMQFGAFCPMMRSHGADAPREIYQFGKKGETIYDAIEKSIKLRYRLLPYIYSDSWEASANRSTMMRPLVMDFAADRQSLDIDNEYMFGKALLVCPVTDPLYSQREDRKSTSDYSTVKTTEVYLPAGAEWYDFYSNKSFDGGQKITVDAPIDRMPLFVKAGSIIPMGPDVQYAEEKPWDNLDIVIYAGADGQFTLYEDEFDNYNYEQGKFSTICFTWNDAAQTLTIGKREGSFDGMITGRRFNVTVVKEGEPTVTSVDYNGESVTVK